MNDPTKNRKESATEQDIDLSNLAQNILRDWKRILGITFFISVISIVYALSLDNIYRAEATLLPIENNATSGSNFLRSFQPLSSITGVNLTSSNDTKTFIAMLESRKLTKEYIEVNNLLPILFRKDWDEVKQSWRVDPEPDLMDGYEEFNDLRSVVSDRQTALVTFSIEWTDPSLAARWANGFIKMANEQFAEEKRDESLRSIDYLNQELKATSNIVMKNIIINLIEEQKREIMFSKVRKDFAFKVLDPAVVPKTKIKPARSNLVILLTILGFTLAVSFSVVIKQFKRS